MSSKAIWAGASALVLGAAALLAPSSSAVTETGNGAPSGAHYTLNIIGVPKDKTADMKGNSGHRIFVPEYGKTSIWLTEGDFQVLDANGTDNDGASFQLPNPDPDLDGTTSYSVFVRALGKPDRSAKMQTCYEDKSTGDTWCAVDIEGGVSQIDITRSKGGVAKFTNESKDLLYVDVCLAVDATTGACTDSEVQPLFGDDGFGYWWEYDNSGLKVAQLRFYEIATVTGW